MSTEEKLAITVQALRDIIDPTAKYEREKRPGYMVDHEWLRKGLAYPSTYKTIAQDALAAIGVSYAEK